MAFENSFHQLHIFTPNQDKLITNFDTVIDSIFRRRLFLQKALKINFLKKMVARKKTIFRKKFFRFFRFKFNLLNKGFILQKYFRHIKNITGGKYHSFKIKLKGRYFNNRKFFFNIL